MNYITPGFLVLHYFSELALNHIIEVVMLSNHLILCHFILQCSNFPSIKVFYNELTLHQVFKVLEFVLQHQSF